MRALNRFFSRVWKFLSGRRGDQRLREEMQAHLAMQTEENMRVGMAPAEAHRQAVLKFGAVESIRESYHAEEGIPLIENLLQDFQYALRRLRRSRGFTLTAVLTLALGIGANAVVFSVLNALILRPLNLPQVQSLYEIEHVEKGEPFPGSSYLDYLDLRDRNRTFSSMFAYAIMGPVGLDIGNNASTVWPYAASGNYFDALGVEPYLGRFFHSSDEHGANSAPYAVLSYAFWHSYFHDDSGVVGRTIGLNKHSFTILGVAPPGFRGSELVFAPDMWLPIVDQPELEGHNSLDQRGSGSLTIAGHLKPGVSPAQATADLDTLAADLARSYPSDDAGESFSLSRPGLMGNFLERPARAFMTGLMLLAALILLAACANLGSLFAARAADRSREIAVRMALGSRRVLILRQLLIEAVLVSLVGGAIGLAGGIGILRWLSTWHPVPNTPVNIPVNPDLRTYIVALVLALVSGLLFGMVPVRQVLRADPYDVIRSGSIGLGMTRKVTLRDLLLAGQIAICAVLITASLVAVRGLGRSLHSNFGFEPNHVMLASTDLHMAGYSGAQIPLVQRRILSAVADIPGVTAAAYAGNLPLSGQNVSSETVFKETASDYRPTNAAADAMSYSVSPGYFRAAGTTLLKGRGVSWQDDSKSPMVAVINRKMAIEIFGSVDRAIGGHFKLAGGTLVEVVGVVQDGKYLSLTEDSRPAMFFPMLQQPNSYTVLIVRSNRAPQEIASALERSFRKIDSGMPFTIEPWNGQLDTVLLPARVATIALGVLGFLGAMLSITGLFGLASYVVSKRLREFGIRVALGASRKALLSAALGRALRLLAIGSVAGLVLGVLASQLLSHIVYQATPNDPLVLGGVIFTMLLLGLVATWIPARRALGADPMILLREE